MRKGKRWELMWMTIAIVSAQTPIFLFAQQINRDEWLKSSTGVVIGALVAVYHIWTGRALGAK